MRGGSITLGDLTVGRLGFGAMRITGPGVWGPPADEEQAKALLRRVLELGVTFIDTAWSYGPAVSEELIAAALHPYPEGLVIGTKGGLVRPGPGRWDPDCRPEQLRSNLEDSLRRLRLDRIDLYQLHAVDPRVPLEESVGVLFELQRAGKIRHVGLSNVDTGELERAQRLGTIVSVQNRYSVGDRASDDVVNACEQAGIAFLPWFPLAAGELARPGGSLAAVAEAHGVTPAQVALAWLLDRSPVMLPIPGTSSVAHLEENVAVAALDLPAAELRTL
jgi:aryl-alcohol dehydrogenase-like predicted oxidoreductase